MVDHMVIKSALSPLDDTNSPFLCLFACICEGIIVGNFVCVCMCISARMRIWMYMCILEEIRGKGFPRESWVFRGS